MMMPRFKVSRLAPVFMCIVLISVLFSQGCVVHSLNPFFTAEAIVDISPLSGEWIMVDAQGKPRPVKPWHFSKKEIFMFDDDGNPGTVKGTCFMVDGTLFLDTVADDPPRSLNSTWLMHLAPLHMLSRVEVQGDAMTISPLDYNWLQERIKDKSISLASAHATDQDLTIFTATPQEWMEFLKKYGKDRNVFSEEKSLRFRKPAVQTLPAKQ